MTGMKPGDELVAWERDTAIERVESCLVMLAAHGFVSEAEKTRIRYRITKWAWKHGWEPARGKKEK